MHQAHHRPPPFSYSNQPSNDRQGFVARAPRTPTPRPGPRRVIDDVPAVVYPNMSRQTLGRMCSCPSAGEGAILDGHIPINHRQECSYKFLRNRRRVCHDEFSDEESECECGPIDFPPPDKRSMYRHTSRCHRYYVEKRTRPDPAPEMRGQGSSNGRFGQSLTRNRPSPSGPSSSGRQYHQWSNRSGTQPTIDRHRLGQPQHPFGRDPTPRVQQSRIRRPNEEQGTLRKADVKPEIKEEVIVISDDEEAVLSEAEEDKISDDEETVLNRGDNNGVMVRQAPRVQAPAATNKRPGRNDNRMMAKRIANFISSRVRLYSTVYNKFRTDLVKSENTALFMTVVWGYLDRTNFKEVSKAFDLILFLMRESQDTDEVFRQCRLKRIEFKVFEEWLRPPRQVRRKAREVLALVERQPNGNPHAS